MHSGIDKAPFRGEPLIKCPVTGFLVHLHSAVWDGTAWVDPIAFRQYGYKEFRRKSPVPHPLTKKRFKSQTFIRFFG